MRKLHLQVAFLFCEQPQAPKPTRTQIIPEKIAVSPVQEHFHVTSNSYDFLHRAKPHCDEIYQISSDTPASILKKNAIHIFAASVPGQSVMEKYKAHLRSLEQDYQKAYQKCKTPAQVFHMERRVKADMKLRCQFIGKVEGKHKHYNLFKSIEQFKAEKTMQEYKKNGVGVSLLGKNKIYPQGPVWLPTNDTYLRLFDQYNNENRLQNPRTILDLGCGSGVLSFLLSKKYKNAKIAAIDSNPNAVQTCKINAASFGLNNIDALQADINNLESLELKLKEAKIETQTDLIVSNPPWLVGKRSEHQSLILDGVYDNKGKFLQSSFKIAAKCLRDNKSRFVLIYSDLSKILGLQKKSVEQLCKQNNLLVLSKLQAEYPKAITNQSCISVYKAKSKIQVFQIARS